MPTWATAAGACAAAFTGAWWWTGTAETGEAAAAAAEIVAVPGTWLAWPQAESSSPAATTAIGAAMMVRSFMTKPFRGWE